MKTSTRLDYTGSNNIVYAEARAAYAADASAAAEEARKIYMAADTENHEPGQEV